MILYDSVRGATNYLISDSTDAEATIPSNLISFEADGFNLLGIMVLIQSQVMLM
jgi:hypothetical protein